MAHDLDTTRRSSVVDVPIGASEPATLVIIRGEPFAKAYDIEGPPLIIGRSRKCSIHLRDDSVSRQHCRVWREGRTYHIRDLGSTNRTRVNGQPIDELVLADGDRIAVGESVLKFVLGGSAEANYHQELYAQATRDSLTGLPNRRMFREVLSREMTACRAESRSLGVAVIDVDHFKAINDSFDHVFGDTVLQRLGEVLTEQRGEGETVARMGGEEFVLIKPGADRQALFDRAEVLRQVIEQSRIEYDGHRLAITVSIGVAQLEAAMRDPIELFRAADAALMRAKQQGRNRVCCADGGS